MSRMLAIVVSALLPLSAQAAGGTITPAAKDSTCGDMKAAYKASQCCGKPTQASNFQVVPRPPVTMFGKTNICDGKKPKAGFNNKDCKDANGAIQALDQAGTNVTVGYKGNLKSSATPITIPYWQAGLCPVNVHWHLGTEHYSAGQYDENGKGSQHADIEDDGQGRRLAAARLGFRCHHYDANKKMYTTPYKWKHCVGMFVGETYEVHWPHSKAGACGTVYQYQYPFYDGVFCDPTGKVVAKALEGGHPGVNGTVGVQAQVYTIVNDEAYYYPNLINGWIVDGDYGKDIAYYTGSTTGTSRSNTVCSSYTPITWQVDRKCHLISASSFDKMCADMKNQMDDMTGDLHAHGSRELVADHLAADNHQRRLVDV